MSAGWYHSAFLLSDGTLWTMGNNSFGQLGIGGTDNRWSPVKIATDVVAVATGWYHTMYLKNDGTLWAVGRNEHGQLGDGTTIDRSSPVQVATHVTAVAAGFEHTLFKDINDGISAMGNNSNGEIGDGTTTDHIIPYRIPTLIAANLAVGGQNTHSLVTGVTMPVATLANQSVRSGQRVTLSPIISFGTGPFGYQWMKNGTNIAGANSPSYIIENASIPDTATYSVTITGVLEFSTTLSATVTVDYPPQVVLMAPTNGVVSPGESISISASNPRDVAISYQWIKDGSILPGATNNTLSFDSFGITDCGNYQVAARFPYGVVVVSGPKSLSMDGVGLGAWGYNAFGQLGNGTTQDQFTVAHVANNVISAFNTPNKIGR
jgi:hypothetical protein